MQAVAETLSEWTHDGNYVAAQMAWRRNSMSYWREKRVLVTGGSGFVGSHLVERLIGGGASVRVCGRSRRRLQESVGTLADDVEFMEGDLADAEFAAKTCSGREVVFHLAAKVAGVGYNTRHPATLIHANTVIGLNVFEAAVRSGVERVLVASSACVYRRFAEVPTPESEGFIGDPEPTNFGYGWAKRFLEVQGRCYAQEHGLKVCLARPYNVYGPRDDFEWETNHVIPALIRRVVEGHDPMVVWGDGSQTRSFIFVEDVVALLMEACEKYAICDPINLGSDDEITIGELVRTIVDIAGFDTRIEFDATKPAGQPRRLGDHSKARTVLQYRPRVTMQEGLARTIEWYRERLRSMR